MIRIKLRNNKYHWESPAAANFFLGGLGSGLMMIYWLLSIGLVGPANPFAEKFIPLISAILVISGFCAVALEAGRPMRGIYVFLNFRTSWMSRELLIGWIFVCLCIAQYVLNSSVVEYLAALFAAFFIFCQAMVLYRSQAVVNWHTWLLPAMLISSDLSAAYGACLLMNLTSSSMLIGGIFILGVHMLVSGFYFYHADNVSAVPSIGKKGGYFRTVLRSDVVGLWIPFGLILILLSGGADARGLASVVCGICILLGIGYKTLNVVCKSLSIIPFGIENPPPERIDR